MERGAIGIVCIVLWHGSGGATDAIRDGSMILLRRFGSSSTCSGEFRGPCTAWVCRTSSSTASENSHLAIESPNDLFNMLVKGRMNSVRCTDSTPYS